jgi:predicted TIM-barrel fold metal-dependent hydrolase
MTEPLLFDAWLNIPSGLAPDPNVAKLFKGQAKDYGRDPSMDEVVVALDQAGVAGGVLTKVVREVTGPFVDALSGLTDEVVDGACAEVATYLQKFPGRFLGSIMLDPRLGYAAARHVAVAVRTYGLRVIRIMPSLSNLPANDPLCYPIYTACCDLGVPVTVNVGVPGPLKPARFQDPMLLDDVALCFPDLKIVMTHMGNPWIDEVVALLARHPNMYLMTSGWAPRYVPDAIRRFMSSRGPNKVMWASDYPLLPIERAVNEGKELDIKQEVLPRYLGLNALEVFGKPDGWQQPSQ